MNSRYEAILVLYGNIQNTFYTSPPENSQLHLVPMFGVEFFVDVSGTISKGICEMENILNTVW